MGIGTTEGETPVTLPSLVDQKLHKYSLELLQRNVALAEQVLLFSAGAETKTPYLIFAKNPIFVQQKIVIELANATTLDNRELVVELGPGKTLSPLTAASHRNNRTVLALDPFVEPSKRYRLGTINVKLPEAGMNSLAAFFSVDPKVILKTEFPDVDLLYSFSPFPNSIENFARIGAQKSRLTMIIPNPDTGKRLDIVVNELNKGEFPNIDVAIKNFSLTEIESVIGHSRSMLHDGRIEKGGKVPVLLIERK